VPALKLVEPTEQKEETVKPATNKTGTSASTTGDYLNKLGDLARRATSLASQVKQLASEIEAVAIEVDDQIKAEHDNSTKLRQLQTLLKSLGD
jgi:predicted transcriptional regulator